MRRKQEKTIYDAIFLYPVQESIYKGALEDTKSIFKDFELEIISEEDMGVKRLAYEIQKKSDGHYYFFKIKTDGININKMNSEFKLKENIMRYMFVKNEVKFHKKALKPQAVREPRERNYDRPSTGYRGRSNSYNNSSSSNNYNNSSSSNNYNNSSNSNNRGERGSNESYPS